MFVLPGTDITDFIKSKLPTTTTTTGEASQPPKIHVGPGIIQTDSGILTLRPGLLTANARSTKFSLKSSPSCSARYLPAQNDLVIGIITARLADLFRVDIGGPQPATLPLLSGFEGATKKSRPAWPVGTVIFARVSAAHPDLEPELACFDPSGNIPPEVFGELGGSSGSAMSSSGSVGNASGGNASTTSTHPTTSAQSTQSNPSESTQPALPFSQLLRTSCSFSRSLQSPSASASASALLKEFSSKWTFEVAAGANGRVFVAGASAAEVAHISRALHELSTQ